MGEPFTAATRTATTFPRGKVTSHQPPPQPPHPEPPAIDIATAQLQPHPYSAPDGEPCHHRRPVLREIPLDQIHTTPGANPRTHFDDDALQALARSIEHDGLLQPIVVRPGPGPLPSWILIAGERRLRAAHLAKLTTLPAIVRGLHDPKSTAEPLTLALIENLHRADLNPIDEARALTTLYMAGVSQAELARRLGRAAPSISNTLRLVTHLPAEVQEHIAAGQLSAAHGRALARYHPYTAVQKRLATWAIDQHWSSHLLEGRTLPNGAQLVSEGLVASPWTHTEPWRSLCPACPYTAYVGGYCLKPEHNAALRQEYQEAKRRPPTPATPLPHGNETTDQDQPQETTPAHQAPTTPEVEDPHAALAARHQAVATKQTAARAWIHSRLANPDAPLTLTLPQERAVALLALLALRPMHRDALHTALGQLPTSSRASAKGLIHADLTDLYGPHERFHLPATPAGTGGLPLQQWLAAVTTALLSHEAELDPDKTPWADWLIDGQPPTPTTTQE